MIHPRIVTTGIAALLVWSALAEAQRPKLKVPVMPGMKPARRMLLSEALEKSDLCDVSKMGPDLAASIAEESGAAYRSYTTKKSVSEVLAFYAKFAAESGMPDVVPSLWDNTKGKEGKDKPKDISGTMTFSADYAKERLTVTVVAYRAEQDKKTTVYVFLPRTAAKH